MAKLGFLGGILGAAAGIALAPATGGASLVGLYALGGLSAGSALGSQLDSEKASKRARREASDMAGRERETQSLLKAERDRASDLMRKERAKIDAGLVRAARRRVRSPSASFINSPATNQASQTIG